MRARLFWKLGLTYLVLLILVLLAVDWYSARALRSEYLRIAFQHLDALMKVAEPRLPALDDAAALSDWAQWMKRSGARATVIAADGTVLADSHQYPRAMENHAGRPEVREAMETGRGMAVRFSTTVQREMVDLAIRRGEGESAVIVRLGLSLQGIEEARAAVRRQLAVASFFILALAGGASLLFARRVSQRIERLKEFAGRVAHGDFRPMALDRRQKDELAALAAALNETAEHLESNVRTLTEERNRSAAVLGSMAEGVAVFDSQEKLVFCNDAFCRNVGLTAGECAGRSLVEVIRPPEAMTGVRRVLQGDGIVTGELELGTVRQRIYTLTAAPVGGTGGVPGVAGAVLVMHDMTEHRRLERIRRDFVANVSHEFKTPLTAIQGFAETLLGGALDDRENSRRFLEIIRDHSVRLSAMTSDLLKLARIEAGKLEMEKRAVNLPDLIRSCVETARLRATEKNLALQVECADGIPPVMGDASHLREALENLLENAVRYTPPGGKVSVTAGMADGSGPARVIITVADTGIGIPQIEQDRVFERFYRVEDARSREAGGTGLGLAITKHIIEAHGGRIWLESEVGCGSRFHISLPILS